MYTDGERACVYIAGGGTSLDKKRKRYSRGEICCAREGMGVSRRVEGEGDGERERESAESPPPSSASSRFSTGPRSARERRALCQSARK